MFSSKLLKGEHISLFPQFVEHFINELFLFLFWKSFLSDLQLLTRKLTFIVMWLMLTWLFETSLIRICVKTDNDHLKHFNWFTIWHSFWYFADNYGNVKSLKNHWIEIEANLLVNCWSSIVRKYVKMTFKNRDWEKIGNVTWRKVIQNSEDKKKMIFLWENLILKPKPACAT